VRWYADPGRWIVGIVGILGRIFWVVGFFGRLVRRILGFVRRFLRFLGWFVGLLRWILGFVGRLLGWFVRLFGRLFRYERPTQLAEPQR